MSWTNKYGPGSALFSSSGIQRNYFFSFGDELECRDIINGFYYTKTGKLVGNFFSKDFKSAGLDSLERVELKLYLEEVYGITLPEIKLRNTFEGIVRYLRPLFGRSEASNVSAVFPLFT